MIVSNPIAVSTDVARSTSTDAVTPIRPWVKVVLWFVCANALLGALSLLSAPTEGERLFFWSVKPPVSARLFGALYLGGALAVAWVAWRGAWEHGRVLVPILVVAGMLITFTTFLHADRFTGGFRFAYWLAIYIGAPLLALAAYVDQERRGARWQAREPLRPRVRTVALALGAVLVFGGLIALARPDPFVASWPWPTSPLMVRIFSSWFTAFGAGLLWFGVERDWRGVRLVAWLMLASGVADLLVLFVHLGDLPQRGLALAVYALHLAAFAGVGGWMIAEQRRGTASSTPRD